MEPAVFDDSMEVASDAGHRHPGNIDDIDIDLDIAQERVSEHDDDVLVDDASATASDNPTAEADVTYDAYMADGDYMDGGILASGYDQFHQGYYQLDDDSAYNNPIDYEAEMEEDYEEDIDAPIPDSGFEDTNVPIAKEVEGERKTEIGEGENEGEEVKVADDTKRPAPEALSKSEHVETEISKAIPVAEEDRVVQEDTDIFHPKGTEEFAVEEGNEVSQVVENAETAPLSGSHEKYGEEVELGLEDGHGHGHGHGQAEPEPQEPNFQESEHQEPEAEGQYHPPLDQGKQSDTTETYHFVEAEDYESQSEEREVEKNRTLHPVKVLYQDSEISLFPPVEDDPTETFFLQDEGLAHAPIKELVGACRQVLGEHISDDEELILDIESLGLHLPEVKIIFVFFFFITRIY